MLGMTSADVLEISPATYSDLDAIHRLEAASFPSPWRREFFESEINGESRLHFVARRGATIVGYVFAMWVFDEMHVNKIAVAERERRKSVAAKSAAGLFSGAARAAASGSGVTQRPSSIDTASRAVGIFTSNERSGRRANPSIAVTSPGTITFSSAGNGLKTRSTS